MAASFSTHMLSPREVTSLLSKLCCDHGFCLPPTECERLRSECPPDVVSFTNAVFTVEGLPPQGANAHLYREVKSEVTAAFQRHLEQAEFEQAVEYVLEKNQELYRRLA